MAAVVKNPDFTSANASTLVVDPVDRPAGDIAYLMSYPDYNETYTYNSGSLQKASFYVKWSEANDFIDFMLGYTTWDRTDPTRFHRVLPAASAYQSNLYVDEMSIVEFGLFKGEKRPAAALNNWMEVDWARYAATYRSRKYSLLTDAEVDGGVYPWAGIGCKELGRYVERIERYVSEERKVSGYLLETYDAATPLAEGRGIPDAGFVPFHRAEIVYIWHQVPYDAVPTDAIAAASLTVNAAAFDKKRNVADSAWVDRWAAETMLFKGLGQELDPYTGPNGELLVDVHYIFSYQPKGWNKFPPPNPATVDWTPVRRRTNPPVTPAIPLYPGGSFYDLFKPRTS